MQRKWLALRRSYLVRMKRQLPIPSWNRIHTTTALKSTNLPPEQKNNLRELLCGCVWTQQRQFDCHRTDSPMCTFCGEEPEDEDLLWRCPQWETLRREKQAPSIQDCLARPPCTSRCGIFLEDPEAVAWGHAGISATKIVGPYDTGGSGEWRGKVRWNFGEIRGRWWIASVAKQGGGR